MNQCVKLKEQVQHMRQSLQCQDDIVAISELGSPPADLLHR